MPKKKIIVQIEAKRENFDLILHLTVDAELENFFRAITGNAIEQSEKWKTPDGTGIKFYRNNEKLTKLYAVLFADEELQQESRYHDKKPNVFDDFGQELMRYGIPNLAPLRIVGATNGVQLRVTELVSYDELKKYVEQLGKLTKIIYREFIAQQNIKAVVMFDF